MVFTSDTLTYKAYTFTYNGDPITPTEETITLAKQADGNYGVATENILIKVAAAALNPVDAKLYHLTFWPFQYLGKKGTGRDYSGTVVSIGLDAQSKTGLKVGDLVQGHYDRRLPHGTVSEYILINPSSQTDHNVGKIPSNLSKYDAAAWPLVYGTAIRITDKLNIKDSRVLVIGGATSVGRFVLQILKREGAAWVASTNSSRSDSIVKELGANVSIDYSKGSILNSVLEEVKSGGTFDYILDCYGSGDLFPEINNILTPKSGLYTTIIGDKSFYSINQIGWFNAGRMIKRILYSGLGFLSFNYLLSQGVATHKFINQGAKEIEEGKLRIFIDSYYKFSEFDKAFEKLQSDKAQGKIIIKIDEE
ncbi:uncharacterized protein RJT21DRAFT_120047 [Scheffersomyces amazonensis]|uniref:uncharacterized protein n=1 Tax=Scheffersomyces amazonensis TaxID=1078765 RepID=UPI00315DEBCD